MTDELEIPAELKNTFKRVIKRAPNELRGDTKFNKHILMYLKLGGEKLARQRIEITKKQFREGYQLITRLIPEESLEEISKESTDETKDAATDNELNSADKDNES